ncbi:hypothetical protein VNI00_001770 [Paramarasmius palmivorus]|uniref:AAA+ ATPase domain-containing protein n=1 Tax=Paramarasmius palmivorus TaxID=297713 RepID=A0AAW0E179_9AGAR
MHWLFRTNIPRRRASYIQPDIRRRNFFGVGEIIGVLTNPAETVRSLAESKRLLEEARREINDTRERAQIRPKHTFSPLPNFLPRDAEIKAIERALDTGEPAFTVLFGASSVGKTALLREVLCRDKYHVLHFDLRIAGFADLASLYTSLCQQMEQYFEEIAKQEGFEEFEKESWSFKHDRLNVEKRLQDSQPESGVQQIKTSDIARLMELFQSSLLKYREFEPKTSERRNRSDSSDANSDQTHVNGNAPNAPSKKKWRFRNLMKSDRKKSNGRSSDGQPENRNENDNRSEDRVSTKKMPVIFFDEAHKLPALIQSTEAMNCLLSTFLVLTKQDRLCHVIHATSDPFYHTWLRQLNVMQHCKIITIGDCSKSETRAFFRERLIPTVPDHLRPGLSFERLYEAFGGKLVHWQDYVTDYVNTNGTLEIKQSSHFLQAHALLNLQIIHASQAPNLEQDSPQTNHASEPPAASTSGFRIYSPITNPHGPFGSVTSSTSAPSEPPEFTAMQLLKVMSRITQTGVDYIPYFMLCREFGVKAVDGMVKARVLDLRWTEIVKGEEVPQPEDMEIRDSMAIGDGVRLVYSPGPGDSRPGSVPGYMNDPMAGSSATAVEEMFGVRPPPPMSPPPAESDEELVAISEREAMMESLRRRPSQRDPPPNPYNDYPQRPTRYPARRSTYHPQSQYNDPYASLMEVVGPKLVPTTPIMRYAMREVVSEYQEDDDDVEDVDMDEDGAIRREGEGGRRRTRTATDGDSEYASLSDVDEY